MFCLAAGAVTGAVGQCLGASLILRPRFPEAVSTAADLLVCASYGGVLMGIASLSSRTLVRRLRIGVYCAVWALIMATILGGYALFTDILLA